jgi:hypothetical protein
VAMGLYTTAFVSFGVTNAFYTAIFPRLARNTRHIRGLKERYEQGEMTADVYKQAEALEKSKISSFSIVRSIFSSRRWWSPFIFSGFRSPWQPRHTFF